MSGVRLYIGGLGGSVDEGVLKRHLATYGTVAQADIKEKKDAEGVIMTRFAYVNIEAPNNQIQQCINSLNGSVWKGSRLKVERARESFMERLARERAGNNQQQQQKGQQQATISRQGPVKDTHINQAQKPFKPLEPLPSIQTQQVNKRPLVIAEQKNIGGIVKKKKVDNSSSESSVSDSGSSESDSSDDSDEVNNGIPMFRGTASFGLDNENEKNNKSVSILNEKKKQVEKEETSKLKSTERVKQYGDSGLFKDSMVRSKDKVEEELLSNFKNFSSVWGDSDDEEDDADNDDDIRSEYGNEESKMEHEEAESKDSSSISKKPGFFIDLQPAKVSSMQSGVAHNKSRSATANEDNEDDGIGDVVSERQSQLDILSNILGKPMEATEHKTDEKKGRQQMKRYDPTLPEHKQYEISREKQQQQQQQQQQSVSQELDKTETSKQEIHTDSMEQQTLNQDKYIKVSQNLNFKEKSEGFSLLSMFSQKKAESSEETDEDEVAESSETITSTQLVTESPQIPKKKGKFFLNEHDAVIDQGIQWLSQSLTQEKCDEFDKIRPELVQVYKTRMIRAKRDAKDSRGRGRVRVRGPLKDRHQNNSDQNKNFGKDKHPHQNSGTDMAKDGKFNSNRKFEGRGRGRGRGVGRGRGQIQGKG